MVIEQHHLTAISLPIASCEDSRDKPPKRSIALLVAVLVKVTLQELREASAPNERAEVGRLAIGLLEAQSVLVHATQKVKPSFDVLCKVAGTVIGEQLLL